MPPMPPVTQALLLINVGMFCAQYLLNLQALALWPVDRGFLPWQVVTYSVLHADMFQLFFNSLGLWMFGAELERVWGGKRFTQFWFASILSGAFVQLALSAALGWGNPTVGASGGLFGLLLAFGMMFPNQVIMPLFPPIPMKAKVFVVVFGALALVLGYLARSAHIGGMIGAFLMIQYWRGRPPFGRR